MPRPHRIDLLLSILLLAGGVVQIAADGALHPVELALSVLLCVPLAWRRSAPVTVVLLCTTAASALAVVSPESSELAVPLVMIVVAYSAGRHLDPPRLYVAAGSLMVIMWTGLALTDGIPADYLFTALFFGGFIGFGHALRRRIGDVEAVHAQREESERDAVAQERARIARELHDIVSHSITVVVLQAQAIERRLGPDHESERADLRLLETTARQAMSEMRRLFGVLRSPLEGDAVSLLPQPGLDQLPRLFSEVRAAGTVLSVTRTGAGDDLPPGVDLAAYRIVQEALTNVRKHAPGASADVTILREERAIRIDVVDDGPGARSNGHGGHGLVGMRERVALYGGELSTGDAPGGGYSVRARLPL